MNIEQLQCYVGFDVLVRISQVQYFYLHIRDTQCLNYKLEWCCGEEG